MVDQSLLRQAADRGVTICFADLDGADGLWVPEERTVLVNRGLSDAKVAEVIEHELAHVMIDDQHADLDAGKDVLVGEPPSPGRRREAVALAAALGLVAVVGGVMYGIHSAQGPAKRDQVAPNNGPGLTAQESGSPFLSPSRRPDGKIIYVPVYPTAPSGDVTGPPFIPPSGGATATTPLPQPTARRSPTRVPAPPGPTASVTPPAPTPTIEPPPPTTPPPSDPTTDPPTTPPAETGGAGDTGAVGGTGGGTDNAPLGTDPAAVDGASAAVPVGDTGTP